MTTTASTIERAMERSAQRQAAVAEPALEEARTHDAEPCEADEALDSPRAVELDFTKLRRMGMLTPIADQRRLAEQYRIVKRPLLSKAFHARGSGKMPANLVQVTSSVVNEGKTFTVLNLGMSIAMEMDYTVMLIDADLTRRSMTQLLGLQDRAGLTEALSGRVSDIGEVIHPTNVPKLRVIPAGAGHARSTELIASELMRRFTWELANRYPDRLVVFDSTPLLMDSQAATLARHMGQVVVVVEAGRTSEQSVQEAVGLLDHQAAWISLLLNKSARSYGDGYYGGY